MDGTLVLFQFELINKSLTYNIIYYNIYLLIIMDSQNINKKPPIPGKEQVARYSEHTIDVGEDGDERMDLDDDDDEYGDEIIDLGDDIQPFSMQFKKE